MDRNELLSFAKNEDPTKKGLIYSVDIDQLDKVKIEPLGFIADCPFDENIVVHLCPRSREPEKSEIDEALNAFIALNGLDVFKRCNK